MDVPLWAFLLSSALSGALGAGAALFGTLKVADRQHQIDRERLAHEKSRWEFESKAEARVWRMEQRNKVYGDVVHLLEVLNATIEEGLKGEVSEEQLVSNVVDVSLKRAALRLHGSPDVAEEAESCFRIYLGFVSRNNVTERLGTSAVDWQETLAKLKPHISSVHKLIREHLDTFE